MAPLMLAIGWPRVMPVDFTHPVHLLWLPPAIALLVWLSRRSYADLSPARRRVALGLRIALVGAVVLALAGAQAVRGGDALCTVFVLDVSESVPEEAQASALAYIEEATETMRRDDQAALVVFGGDAYLELAPGPRRKIRKIASAPSGRSTDLAAALRLALAAFPEGMSKRIVLLSDGNQTTGSAVQQALAARSQRAPIDVVPLRRNLTSEVLLERAVVPASVKRGEPFEMRLIASSMTSTAGTVRVFRGGKHLGDQQVNLAPGKNVFTFPQAIDEPGFYSYDLVIEAEADTLPQNNRALGFVEVKREKPKVLYVDGQAEEARHVWRALEANQIDVEVTGPEGIPTSLAELQNYDGLVYSDLVAWASTPQQMQMVQSSVRDLGMGFAMVGGENAFGAGGYFDTPIEETLPVDMSIRKQRVLPSTAILIVIDKSGSMGATEDGVEKIRLAAEAAVAVIDLLQPIDQVGVMATDTVPQMVAPITPIRSKHQIIDDVLSIRAGGGGIMVYPSLERADRELREVKARVKHVILLADGSDSEAQAGSEPLAARMARKKITVTAVAIGDGPDVPFLQRVAKAGKGNFYLADSAHDLPRIFTRDAMVMTKSLIVEEPFLPRVDPGHEALRGIDWSQAPPLLGYVTTSAKSLAAVGMQAPTKDPVFATWQYGLGRSVAFTSDAKARWATRWLDWPGFGPFWAQAMRWMMRRSPSTNLQLLVSEEHGRGKIRVDAFDEEGEFLNFLPLEGRVVVPGRQLQTRRVGLEQTGPGRYEGSFEAAEVGTYLVDVRKKDDPGGETATLVVPYPAEYRRLKANDPLLGRLARETGGRLEPPPEAVYAAPRTVARHPRDLWPLLAGLALALLPFDVAIRRLMVDPRRATAAAARVARRVRARRARPAVARQPVLGRLLAAKDRTRSPSETAEAEPSAVSAEPTPSAQAAQDQPASAEKAPPEQPPEPGDDRPTSRLLRAKRRAKQ